MTRISGGRYTMTLHTVRAPLLSLDCTDVGSRGSAGAANVRPYRQRATHDTVLMLIRIDTPDVRSVRETLHRTLGDALGIYVVTIDKRQGCASLQVEVPHSCLDKTMSAIMAALPEAEFGAIRSAHRGRAH
jgi:hypothetical protein